MKPDSKTSDPGAPISAPDQAGATFSAAPDFSMPPDPAVHRQLVVLRWLIRTAYIVLAIGLIAVSPFILSDWRRSARHWRAAALLNSMGGAAEWNRKSSSWWSSGATLVRLSGRRKSGQASDKDLALLRDLIHVESLDITNCPKVSDQGLAVLNDLPDLEMLDLGQVEKFSPPITDVTIVLVNRLSRLRSLGLASTNITDERFARLTELKNLEVLDLDSTPITDAALRTLKQNHPRLETVMLNGTAVSKEGLIDLRKAMPTLQILQEMYDENALYPGATTPAPRP